MKNNEPVSLCLTQLTSKATAQGVLVWLLQPGNGKSHIQADAETRPAEQESLSLHHSSNTATATLCIHNLFLHVYQDDSSPRKQERFDKYHQKMERVL